MEREEIRLMGTGEVARFLRVTPGWVHQLRRIPRFNFPEPLATLDCGPVWLAQDVEKFATVRRRPGPKKKTETRQT